MIVGKININNGVAMDYITLFEGRDGIKTNRKKE